MISFIICLLIGIISCLALIHRYKNIALRATLIIIIVAASLVNFWLITMYAGKPLSKAAPDDMVVYGQAIDIQNKRIYILHRKPSDDFPPILIEVPYRKPLGEALRKGSQSSKGKPFRIKKGEGEKGEGKGKADGKGGGKGKGDGKGKEGGGSMSLDSETWNLIPLPPPIMPKKDY